jgi:hypothetical protein
MSLLKIFNVHSQLKTCRKCGKDFVIGEEIVNSRYNFKTRSHGKAYHKACYTDAKGIPIYGKKEKR